MTWRQHRSRQTFHLRIGGSCGLVRSLFTCSLHDEASSENQRRVQTHAEDWHTPSEEWKRTPFQNQRDPNRHTRWTEMQNHGISPRSTFHNKRQTHFNGPWSSAEPHPVCYRSSGLSVWQNRSEAGTLNSAVKFLQHTGYQQMRSTSPPFGE